MSIASALLGLGIALTIAGGIGTFAAIIETLTVISCGEGRATRRRACIFLAVMVGILAAGAFFLGLTIPAVQS